MPAGEEGGTRRGARRHRIVPIQNDAVVGEGVDVGRRYLVRAVEAHVVPALRLFWRLVVKVIFSRVVLSFDEQWIFSLILG